MVYMGTLLCSSPINPQPGDSTGLGLEPDVELAKFLQGYWGPKPLLNYLEGWSVSWKLQLHAGL